MDESIYDLMIKRWLSFLLLDGKLELFDGKIDTKMVKEPWV